MVSCRWTKKGGKKPLTEAEILGLEFPIEFPLEKDDEYNWYNWDLEEDLEGDDDWDG